MISDDDVWMLPAALRLLTTIQQHGDAQGWREGLEHARNQTNSREVLFRVGLEMPTGGSLDVRVTLGDYNGGDETLDCITWEEFVAAVDEVGLLLESMLH